MGGAGAYDGDSYLLLWLDVFWGVILFVPYAICLIRTKGIYHEKAADGKLGGNGEDIEYPNPVNFINPSFTINSYKSFLRENMANNIQESRLRKFMLGFEMDERVKKLYNTLGLFDDLKCLENQYLQLRNSLSFLPFHESLLNRTSTYANSTQVPPDHTKVLRFIYTASAGKISNLRNFRQHVLVIDLQEYFQIVEKNINKLREIQKEVSIREQTKQYEKILNDKISAALDLVNKEVLPELFKIFQNLANDIPKLVDQATKKSENQTSVAFKKGSGGSKGDSAVDKLQQLQDAIRKFQVAGVLRFVARIASFYGKTGEAIAKYIKLAAAAVDAYSQVNLQGTMEGLKNIMNNVVQFLKEDYLVYLKQMDHIIWLIQDFPNCFDDVRKFIEEAKDGIFEVFDSESPFEFLKDYIEEKRLELGELIKKIQKECPLESDAARRNAEAAKAVNGIEDVDKDSFDKFKNDTDKIITFFTGQEQSKNEMNSWKARLKEIKSKLIPMFFQMQQTIINMTSSLENQTAVELDITAWKIQTVVGDVKLLFNQMSEGTTLQDQLQRNVEKISETFAVIIKIYDRVQSYMDQAKFAAYLANIQSPTGSDIADPKLREIVSQVKLIIQTNLVMDQYQIAIHSFKQHQFPFAHIHLATFDLPTGLEVNDTKTIVSRAVDEISYLQELTKFLAISIGKFDRDVFGDIDFNSNNGSIAVPFYTFRSREYKNEVKRLLNGEAVMINADIRYAVNQNAIKFNEIGIDFRLVNENADTQSKLNAVLDNFAVRMTMIGHNYYRCGNKFFYLSVDDNLVIEYSFKRNPDRKPIKVNDVFRKLYGKNYFLSPYALWQIQLVQIMDDFPPDNNDTITQRGFEALNKFNRDPINIELVGRGQYLRAGGETAKEVCTDEIQKYYFSDYTTKEINDIERTKMIYLM